MRIPGPKIALAVLLFFAVLGAFSLVFGGSLGLNLFPSLQGSLAPELPAIPYSFQAAFCPSPQCVSLPLSALDTAKNRIWVAMYSFTNDGLGDALVRAKARGVDVEVLLEKQEDSSKYSEHAKLIAAGIPVKLDSNPQLMHDKFAVIDNTFVITGSMNWTANGVKENNENVLVINSPELNTQFEKEFLKLWGEGV